MSLPGLPARPLATSAGLGWESVEARAYADPPVTEAFEAGSARLLVVMVTSGRYRIESRHGRSWRRAGYRPGSIGVTAPGNVSELRWRASSTEPMTSLHLHLDPAAVAGSTFPDALTVRDPFVSASARALASALRTRAPALYADSVAQALLTHLTYRSLAAPPRRTEPGLPLSSAQVDRVTDFMRAHLADDLTLDALAGVANVSKFHFVRAFALSTGVTPFRYLRRIRLRQGWTLLAGTRLSVARIAAACGYRSAGQFAAAFKREYGVTPSQVRR